MQSLDCHSQYAVNEQVQLILHHSCSNLTFFKTRIKTIAYRWLNAILDRKLKGCLNGNEQNLFILLSIQKLGLLKVNCNVTWKLSVYMRNYSATMLVTTVPMREKTQKSTAISNIYFPNSNILSIH